MNEETTGPMPQNVAGGETPLSDIELRFYYFGFYKALMRYRRMTLLGWVVAATGCGGMFAIWSAGRIFGVPEIILSCSTIAAGIALVSMSVSVVQQYIGIALPTPHNGQSHPLVHEVAQLMQEVDLGGWQEAAAAIRVMETFPAKYGVPHVA